MPGGRGLDIVEEDSRGHGLDVASDAFSQVQLRPQHHSGIGLAFG
jgi:hypothetical protein